MKACASEAEGRPRSDGARKPSPPRVWSGAVRWPRVDPTRPTHRKDDLTDRGVYVVEGG